VGGRSGGSTLWARGERKEEYPSGIFLRDGPRHAGEGKVGIVELKGRVHSEAGERGT